MSAYARASESQEAIAVANSRLQPRLGPDGAVLARDATDVGVAQVHATIAVASALLAIHDELNRLRSDR